MTIDGWLDPERCWLIPCAARLAEPIVGIAASGIRPLPNMKERVVSAAGANDKVLGPVVQLVAVEVVDFNRRLNPPP